MVGDGNILKAPLRSGSYHLLVVNASNREKIVEWLRPYLEDSPGIRMTDVTTSWAMLAVQGPKSRQLVQPLIEAPLVGLNEDVNGSGAAPAGKASSVASSAPSRRYAPRSEAPDP